MILNPMRALTDAYNSSTYGVNVQIGAVQLDGGDSRPATMSLITNSTKATWVAVVNANPPSGSLPAIGVIQSGPFDVDGEIQGGALRRQAHVTLLSRVFIRQSKTDKGDADMYYSLRAMEKCIGVFMSAAHESDRLRNGIQICECTSMRHGNILNVPDDNLMESWIETTFRVRDLNP